MKVNIVTLLLLLVDLHWLPVKFRIEFKILLIFFFLDFYGLSTVVLNKYFVLNYS